MIKAVLFDMDGILFDTEIVMKEGWLKAARELNFTLTEEHLSQMRGSALPRSRKLFEEWFHGKVTYDEGRAIRSAYLNDYIQRNGVPEKPGLHEFLSWLKEHSIKVAVATSTTRRVAEGYWKQSGIDQYIDASVCGDEVVNSKPAPEIFLKAASLLQVPIAECMVAEDSINGLKAARASGAVSADGYPVRADAELRCILQHPAISGETVFQTDGKCVFRQQPIIHGNDFAWRIQCIAAGQLFVTGG